MSDQFTSGACTPAVLILNGSIPPVTGGELYAHKLHEYLLSAGINSQLINVQAKREELRTALHRFCWLAWTPVPGEILLSLILLWSFRKFKGVLVVDHWYAALLMPTSTYHRLLRGNKVVIIVHHIENYRNDGGNAAISVLKDIKHKLGCLSVDKIITVSRYTRAQVLSLSVSPTKLFLLPPGFDNQLFPTCDRTPGQENETQILSVSHVITRKGLFYLIDALAKIERRGFKLHIVGSTTLEPACYRDLTESIYERNLSDFVVFHGRIGHADLCKLFSSSDLFVLPSLQEGFGIVLLEAMHYGLPIIATDAGAISELVENEVNGLLVKPADSQALSVALARLIHDQALRAMLGQAGKHRIENHPNWSETGSKFLELVRSFQSTK